ncbi:hypothetical protein V6N13_114206 [Hibiscus sabdariffa]
MDAAAAETLNNPRKHRRFDKEPPGRGGPGNRSFQPDVVVDADGFMVPPSYKDSLLHGSGTSPDSCSDIVRHQQPMSVNDPPQHPADQSLGIVATSATSGASKPVVDNTPYGPWMGIILRENRFTAISMPDSSMGDDNDTNAPARPSSSDRVAPKAPLVFRAKQRVKGKSHVVFKGSSGTHIRKPLTLSNFPVLSRSSHKAGSSRSVPTNVVSLDASKHSVVVIGENSYPNIQQPMQQVSDLPPLQQHLLGDPPDCNPGIGEIPVPTTVRTQPMGVSVVVDDHIHERGGDHAIAMLE